MAKKKKESTESNSGEQLPLIEVGPENSKKIKAVAKRYKAAAKERQAALAVEVEEKEKLLVLIHEAKLKPLEDGTIRFQVDGMTITVKPRDELVRVKDDNEGEEE